MEFGYWLFAYTYLEGGDHGMLGLQLNSYRSSAILGIVINYVNRVIW